MLLQWRKEKKKKKRGGGGGWEESNICIGIMVPLEKRAGEGGSERNPPERV